MMTDSIMHNRTHALLDFCKQCNRWHIPVYSHQDVYSVSFDISGMRFDVIDQTTGEIFLPNRFHDFVLRYRAAHIVIKRGCAQEQATDARVPSALALARSAEKTLL